MTRELSKDLLLGSRVLAHSLGIDFDEFDESMRRCVAESLSRFSRLVVDENGDRDTFAFKEHKLVRRIIFDDIAWHDVVDGARITSPFGAKRGAGLHAGVDYIGSNLKLRAPFSGYMTCHEDKYAGKYAAIHVGKWGYVALCHMDEFAKRNCVVKRGQVVGLMGNTGRSRGKHVHVTTKLLGLKWDAEQFSRRA
jgi:murein DD-endopeptidase MepM/ murein hydrolase activator NlpD